MNFKLTMTKTEEDKKKKTSIQVVSTLSSCPTATLGVVRDYLLRTLDSEERSIQVHCWFISGVVLDFDIHKIALL